MRFLITFLHSLESPIQVLHTEEMHHGHQVSPDVSSAVPGTCAVVFPEPLRILLDGLGMLNIKILILLPTFLMNKQTHTRKSAEQIQTVLIIWEDWMTIYEYYASDPAVYAGLVDLQMDVDKFGFWFSVFQGCPGFRKLKNYNFQAGYALFQMDKH